MFLADLIVTAPNWKEPKYINWQTNKQIVVHPYNEWPLSNKKELLTHMTTQMKSQKCFLYAGWKKPDTQDYKLYYSISLRLKKV